MQIEGFKLMTIKDMKLVKTNRSIAFFDGDHVCCDLCRKKLYKDQNVMKAKVRDGYCNTSVYVCIECYEAKNDNSDAEKVFKEAFKARGDRIGKMLSNCGTLELVNDPDASPIYEG